MGVLDETDRKILKLVQTADYCKPNLTAIAEEIDIAIPTLHARIKKLEDDGIVTGYSARIDSKKVGEKITVFAILRVNYAAFYADKKKQLEFGEKLAAIPEVKEVHVCGSDWDYLIKVRAKDSDDYYHIASEKILALGSIEKLESVVAYNTFKDSNEIAFQ